MVEGPELMYNQLRKFITVVVSCLLFCLFDSLANVCGGM